MLSTNSLKDKVAIITGASQGLGKQFATLVAANGAKVALAARQVPKLEELKNNCQAELIKLIDEYTYHTISCLLYTSDAADEE